MSALTAQQRSDLQIDLGLTDDEGVFTNDELDRLWTRMTEAYTSYTEAQQLTQLRLKCIQILRMNSVKLFDYQLAQQIEKRSQVFEHLKAMEEDLRRDLGVDNQVAIVGALYVPPRDRTLPDGSRG